MHCLVAAGCPFKPLMTTLDKAAHFLAVSALKNNSRCEAVEPELATSQKMRPRLKVMAMADRDAPIYGVPATRGRALSDTCGVLYGSSCSSK